MTIGETKPNESCGARFINYEHGVKPDIAPDVGISGLIDCIDKVTIEKYVFSGHDIMILTGSHDYNLFGNARKVSTKKAPVTIKEGAWLCSRCIILQGVTIGKYAVIGAGSIVTKDIPDYEFWAGNPAIPIKLISKFPKKIFPKEILIDKELCSYICGFVDGEGSFSMSKNGDYKQFRFSIESDYRDKNLYDEIFNIFKSGQITERRRISGTNQISFHSIIYTIGDKETLLNKVIPFFDTFELRGFKRIKYQRWREEYLKYCQLEYGDKKI